MREDNFFSYFDEKGEKVKVNEKGWLGQTLCKHEFRDLNRRCPFVKLNLHEIERICPKCGASKGLIPKK